MPNAASQRRVAFSSIAWNTGSNSPGDELMTLSTSAVAVCCSSDSLNSRGASSILFLQIGVGLLKLASHLVELVGQRLDFVAGLDADALGEIAGADACRAGAQRLDRHHHPAGEKHAGDESERERAEQHQAGALDRSIKRRVGLLDRRLDEDHPAERGDRRVGGEHLLARNVLGLLDLLAGIIGRGSAGATHLHEARHVGVAQHQADVGMRDQAALGIDHIGVAVLAHFDLRNDVPDELEVDLRDADAGSRRVPASESVM